MHVLGDTAARQDKTEAQTRPDQTNQDKTPKKAQRENERGKKRWLRDGAGQSKAVDPCPCLLSE